MSLKEDSSVGAETKRAGHLTEAEWAVMAAQVWVEHFSQLPGEPGECRLKGRVFNYIKFYLALCWEILKMG